MLMVTDQKQQKSQKGNITLTFRQCDWWWV